MKALKISTAFVLGTAVGYGLGMGTADALTKARKR